MAIRSRCVGGRQEHEWAFAVLGLIQIRCRAPLRTLSRMDTSGGKLPGRIDDGSGPMKNSNHALWRQSGICGRTQNANPQQNLLPVPALAHLDLGVFSRARSADLLPLRARLQRGQLHLAGAGAGGHGHRGILWADAGRGTGALHSPLRRGQAQPALPQSLLHLRVECGAQLRAAESGGTGDCDHHRCVGDAAALPIRLPAAVHTRSCCWVRRGCCRAWAVRPKTKARSGVTFTARYGRSRSPRRCCWCCGRPCRRRWRIRARAAPSSWCCMSGTLAGMGMAAWQGALPRTRPILPGELMVD